MTRAPIPGPDDVPPKTDWQAVAGRFIRRHWWWLVLLDFALGYTWQLLRRAGWLP